MSKKEWQKLYYQKNRDKLVKYNIHYYYKRGKELRDKRIQKMKDNGTYTDYRGSINKKRREREYPNKKQCHYFRKYGITREDKKNMLINQDNACLICKKDLPFNKSVIDHCHTTNKVRGILCNQCNAVLGFSYDNIDTLKNAIEYLNINK